MFNKKSSVWLHFYINDKEKSKYRAICNYCKNSISYKGGSTSNLFKHLKSKHPIQANFTSDSTSARGSVNEDSELEVISLEDEFDNHNFSADFVSTESGLNVEKNVRKTSTQNTLHTFVKKPVSLVRQKKIDDKILDLITSDLQPFSIVEDEGFIQLINYLEPNYKMISKYRLSESLLPVKYEEKFLDVKAQIDNVSYISLTTDTWTSCNTQNFMAVTGHLINAKWEMKSFVLDCFYMPESHTSENLRDQIIRVAQEWKIEKKIVAITTDNAANIKRAVNLTGYVHIPCAAHTTNLVVQEALSTIHALQVKVKTIVEYFHRSTTAASKLESMQRQTFAKKQPLKLKMDVVTRWNSTYVMFERMIELKDIVSACLGALHNPVPSLNSEEWDVATEIVQALQPFDLLTKEFSSEKSISSSKVLVLINGVQMAMKKVFKNCNREISKNLITKLEESFNRRFSYVFTTTKFSCPTFLDPRFKHKVLSKTSKEETKKIIMEEIQKVATENHSNNKKKNLQVSDKSEQKSNVLWEYFDKNASNIISTSTSSAIIEYRQYVEEKLEDRNINPLEFWKSREILFPLLSKVARKYLCAVASSVPSERIFSKTGQIVSDRRSRLLPDKVKMITFLNINKNKK